MSMSLLDLIVALTQTASLPSEHARAKRRRDRIVFWALVALAVVIGLVALVAKLS
jgi:uncharacterized membrane protein